MDHHPHQYHHHHRRHHTHYARYSLSSKDLENCRSFSPSSTYSAKKSATLQCEARITGASDNPITLVLVIKSLSSDVQMKLQSLQIFATSLSMTPVQRIKGQWPFEKNVQWFIEKKNYYNLHIELHNFWLRPHILILFDSIHIYGSLPFSWYQHIDDRPPGGVTIQLFTY